MTEVNKELLEINDFASGTQTFCDKPGIEINDLIILQVTFPYVLQFFLLFCLSKPFYVT